MVFAENACYQPPDRASPSVLGAPLDRLRANACDSATSSYPVSFPDRGSGSATPHGSQHFCLKTEPALSRSEGDRNGAVGDRAATKAFCGGRRGGGHCLESFRPEVAGESARPPRYIAGFQSFPSLVTLLPIWSPRGLACALAFLGFVA
jgi:hypothetical protein